MTDDPQNYDHQIRLAIGNLLKKADPITKSVISAYDSSKDVSANKSLLGGSRFTIPALEACAKFLNIELTDSNERKLFTNKPSLANRIILEIQSLLPATCGECLEQYSVEHNTANIPSLRCFLCFQGCHDCEQVTALLPDASIPLSSGWVWLCKPCREVNNPVKPKKGRSRAASSKSASNPPSLTATPNTVQRPPVSPSELADKLVQVLAQQSSAAATSQHSVEIPATLPTDSQVVEPSTDSAKVPQTVPAEICELYKDGRCPHGIGGKTLVNNQACNKLHPKVCRKFVRNGSHQKWGCKKGANCNRYHPIHCSTSLANKTCFDANCRRPHLVGTKRKKPEVREPLTSGATDNTANQGGQARTTLDRRPEQRRSDRRQEQQRSQRPRTTSTVVPSNSDQRFLELRNLLTSFQSQIQEEVKELKAQMAQYKAEVPHIPPVMHYYPPQMNQVVQKPIPAPSIPFQQPMTQSAMTMWRFPGYGC